MTTEEIILTVLGLGIPLALVIWTRWTSQKLERDDPARQDGPAE